MNNFLLYGSDPEMFAGYKKEDKWYALPPVFFRKYLGIDIIRTEKGARADHPVFFEDIGSGIKWIEDGAAFELTVSPSDNWMELFDKIYNAKKILENKILSKFPDQCDSEVKAIPTIGYEIDRWSKEDIDFQMCNVFGCDEDKDAFNVEYDGQVINALKHPWRYAGGHVHFSGRKSISENPLGTIASLAFTLGLAATAFSPHPELENTRAQMYGKPGRYRVQEYGKLWNNIPYTNIGVEYRTPSTSWTGDFNLASMLFDWAKVGIEFLLEKKLLSKLGPKIGEEVKDAISTTNQKKALELLNIIEGAI